jgi:hypothetical protein
MMFAGDDHAGVSRFNAWTRRLAVHASVTCDLERRRAPIHRLPETSTPSCWCSSSYGTRMPGSGASSSNLITEQAGYFQSVLERS